MDVILIEFAVKGYHECGFTLMVGETFFLEKIGSRGEAFRVASCKGQLGHNQKELVEALLYVILKAHAICIFVTVLLATLSVEREAKKITINFIDVQVAL